MKGLFLLTLGLVFVTLVSSQTDQTLQPLASGWDVSDAVIRKIQRSGIFPNDQNFLRRLGFVQSRFGEDPLTYRPSYFGGIWQLDEPLFNRTKDNSTLFPSINSTFGIQWGQVSWNDLLKPLYSGLATRLYLDYLPEPIPGTTSTQASFWVKHFSPNHTAQYFINQTRVLESDGPICEGMMDFCVVLDGSGSIGNSSYQLAKRFVSDLVGTFSLGPESTRVAMVLYGTTATQVFNFNNTLTSVQMTQTILTLPYPNSRTNTPAALRMAVDFFSRSTPRQGVPRMVATFTDGNHNEGVGTLPNVVRQMRDANLTSFAIGIGDNITQSELVQIALDDLSKVFPVNDYDALLEFFRQMNQLACEIPQEPEVGQNQTGSLNRREKRYFKFNVPEEGLTLRVQSAGSIAGWFSYSEGTPNSALNDGVLRTSGTFIQRGQTGSGGVFVTIQNMEESKTDYILDTREGNHSGANFIKFSYKLALISLVLLIIRF